MQHVLQVDAEVGAPRVNYRETITKRANFDYLHKKQSGGQGQYGRVVGYIEPLPEGSAEKFEYANEIVGNAIPPNYLPSCKKGFEEAINSGALPCIVSSYPTAFAGTTWLKALTCPDMRLAHVFSCDCLQGDM